MKTAMTIYECLAKLNNHFQNDGTFGSKARELDAARRAAIWLDASDEDLTAPGLEQRLLDRLPALMMEFKAAVESLGLIY